MFVNVAGMSEITKEKCRVPTVYIDNKTERDLRFGHSKIGEEMR